MRYLFLNGLQYCFLKLFKYCFEGLLNVYQLVAEVVLRNRNTLRFLKLFENVILGFFNFATVSERWNVKGFCYRIIYTVPYRIISFTCVSDVTSTNLNCVTVILNSYLLINVYNHLISGFDQCVPRSRN